MRELLRRLFFFLRARRFDRELDAELQFHLDMRQRALEDEGWTAADARRRAHLELGNRLRVREEARDVWLVRWWHLAVQDVTFGWRVLRRTPTLTAAMIVTLALGVGANTAIFSVINTVLLKPLPYADPDRLVLVWATTPTSPATPLTPGNFYNFRTRLRGVTGLAGISHLSVILTGRGPAARLSAMSVSSDFFDLLGARAARGRTFDRRDGPDSRVVVLSHRSWVTQFGSDPGIVGSAVTLQGEPHVVLGVMDAEFVLPSVTPQPVADNGPEVWVTAGPHEIPRTASPVTEDLRNNRRFGFLRAIGRLQPGSSLESLQAEVSAVAAELAERHPEQNARKGAVVVPFTAHLLGSARRPLGVLFAAVVAVLAIACANIAGLLLGRVAQRRREMAVRGALGASRRRLVRQLLTESLLLSAIAAGCGLAVGHLVLQWLITMAPSSLLRLNSASIDATTLAFAMALSVATGLMFGVLPSLQTSRVSPQTVLAEAATRATSGRARQRARRVLVGAEVAAAYLLLAGALVVGRSLWSLVHVHPGYEARRVLAFELFLSGERAEYQRRQVQLYDALLERIRSTPGVHAAGAVVNLPVGGDDFGSPIVVEDAPAVARGAEPRANYQVASADYFAALRIPLLQGRDFSPTDTRDAPPVVIINDTFARRHWPNRSPIGRRVRVGSPTGPWATIVGVVGDVRHGGPAAPPSMEIYEPYTQRSFPFMSFVVRTSGDPLAMAGTVRRHLAELAPDVPMSGISSLEERLARSVGDTRFLAVLLIAFAATAVLLAVVGVYAVVALSVAQRAREVGIRLALGAGRPQMLRLVVGDGSVSAAVGLAAGMGVWLLVGRNLQALLFDVTPRDAVTLLASLSVIGTATIAATLIPMRRVTATPLSAVLRVE